MRAERRAALIAQNPITRFPFLSSTHVHEQYGTTNVELKIGGLSEIQSFLLRNRMFGDLHLFSLVGTNEKWTKMVDGIEYALLSNGACSLWVPEADKYALDRQMDAQIGSTSAGDGLDSRTLYKILCGARVKTLHAVLHTIDPYEGEKLLDFLAERIRPEQMVDGELCYFVAQSAGSAPAPGPM